jgi:hypothetical protein
MTMTTPAAIDDVVGPLQALLEKAANDPRAHPWIAREDGLPEMCNVTAFIDTGHGAMVSYGHLKREDRDLIVAVVNALPILLALITSLAKERDEAAEQRDALLSALGWKVGPFRDAGVRKVILEDSAGLRPEMVKARGRAQEAEANSAFWQYLAGERVYATQSGLLIRVWEKLKDMRRQSRAATARADAAEREVERVREALQAIRDGNIPRPVGTHWRNDCKPSKHDKYTHGVPIHDDCGQCIDAFIAAALSPVGGV